MGLHEKECSRTETERIIERNSRLVEHARKIYQVYYPEFVVRAGAPVVSMELPHTTDTGGTASLHFVFKGGNASIRHAAVALEIKSLTSSEFERYIVEMGEGPIQFAMYEGEDTLAEPVLVANDQGQQDILAVTVERYLESLSGIESPVTTYKDEQDFWRTALDTCIEEMPGPEHEALVKRLGEHGTSSTYGEFLRDIRSGSREVKDALFLQAQYGSFGAHEATQKDLDNCYLRLVLSESMRRHAFEAARRRQNRHAEGG